MNGSLPFFSIIIPVYNVEPYIRACLDSVIAQSFTDYEVLLIDDGSTDLSGAICDEYAEKHPDRIRVFHTANGGVSSARNRGLDCACGTYVVFVDSDDTVEGSYLDTFYRMIRDHDGIDLAVCGVSINGRNIVLNGSQHRNGILTKEVLTEELVRRRSIRGFLFNKAFRRSIIEGRHIRLDESAHMCEDLLFCAEFSQYLRQACLLNSPNYDYIQRSDSAVHQRFNPKRISVLDTYERIIQILDRHASSRAVQMARTNLLMHHVNIFLMVRSNPQYSHIAGKTKRYIRHNIGHTFRTELEFSARLKALLAFTLSFLPQVPRRRSAD